jgi:hypothetical protein
MALGTEAAEAIRSYSPDAATEIEQTMLKVTSNQPRALILFRSLSRRLLDLGEEHILHKPGDEADEAFDQWYRLATDIDKGLRRLQNSAAARTYDHSREFPVRCPSCGHVLATPFSRQCFDCGTDWH